MWKWIPGYENEYQVSDRGEVRSFKNKGGQGLDKEPHTLSPGTGERKIYPHVSLSHDKIVKSWDIHALMMIAFCPIENRKGMEVNHIDGIKTHNTLENLEWTTRKGNAQHATAVLGMSVGENNSSCKLSREQVKQIRDLYSLGGTSQSVIASMYGVTQSAISAIVTFKRWSTGT